MTECGSKEAVWRVQGDTLRRSEHSGGETTWKQVWESEGLLSSSPKHEYFIGVGKRYSLGQEASIRD